MRIAKQLKYTNITAEEFSNLGSVKRILDNNGGSCWFEVKQGIVYQLIDGAEPNLVYVCLSTKDDGVYYVF
jgi:hypothetical protein